MDDRLRHSESRVQLVVAAVKSVCENTVDRHQSSESVTSAVIETLCTAPLAGRSITVTRNATIDGRKVRVVMWTVTVTVTVTVTCMTMTVTTTTKNQVAISVSAMHMTRSRGHPNL